MIKQSLIEVIRSVLREIGLEAGEVTLEHPGELSHGDYATNVALAYARKAGKKPRDLAEEILAKLKEAELAEIESMDIAGPGFINFHLSRTFFAEAVRALHDKGEKVLSSTRLSGKKIMVEYTNTNLFKELHIGHMMSNNIGESLSRILEAEGAEVKRDTYQGDVGLNVAKALYGMQVLASEMPREGTLHEKIAFLGKAYAHGSVAYEENKDVAEKIKILNKATFEKSDKALNELYAWGKEVSLAHFEELYKKLGTKFDFYFLESEIADRGLSIVREQLQKGIFAESEGAIVFKGEEYGLHTRVFVSSQGLPMYEAKELGLAHVKAELYPFDTAIIITANEQNEYFKVVLKALSLFNPELASRTKHVSHGLLTLPGGKMGSRKGNVITGEGLIMEVEALVRERIKDRPLSVHEKETIEKAVAVGAIKYSILRQSVGSTIVFDFEKSISFEGDSGPYLQYAFARTQSLLEKARHEGVEPHGGIPMPEAPLLEKLLYRFPEVVERAGQEYEPHHIATYLIELSGAFNSFYANEQIVSKDDPYSPYKLALTSAFGTVLKRGLYLLGIEAPQKM